MTGLLCEALGFETQLLGLHRPLKVLCAQCGVCLLVSQSRTKCLLSVHATHLVLSRHILDPSLLVIAEISHRHLQVSCGA